MHPEDIPPFTPAEIAALKAATMVAGVQCKHRHETVIEWAKKTVFDYVMLQNILSGKAAVVVDEALDAEFMLTEDIQPVKVTGA